MTIATAVIVLLFCIIPLLICLAAWAMARSAKIGDKGIGQGEGG
jgi:hypothetical protein